MDTETGVSVGLYEHTMLFFNITKSHNTDRQVCTEIHQQQNSNYVHSCGSHSITPDTHNTSSMQCLTISSSNLLRWLKSLITPTKKKVQAHVKPCRLAPAKRISDVETSVKLEKFTLICLLNIVGGQAVHNLDSLFNTYHLCVDHFELQQFIRNLT